MKRTRTAKERVMRRYPKAYCYEWAGPSYCIYPGTVKIIRGKRTPWIFNNALNVSNPSRRAAWADAAYRIGAGR